METAASLSTTVAQTQQKYYDKLFLKVAEAKLVHKQLGQRDDSVPQGAGGFGSGLVQWTRMLNLTLVSAGQGEGKATTAISLSAVAVTATPAQYDGAVSISDILAYTSFGDIMQKAVQRLAYNAGVSIDTIIRNVIATGGTLQSATGVAGAAWTSIPATGTLTLSEIKKAVRTLRRNDTPELSDGYYVSVIHPDALYDLMVDTSTGGWIDVNKYTESNVKSLLKGEVGKVAGVRFLESSNGYVRGAGITASASIYVTSIFGQEAFGVTELQKLKTYIKGFGSAGAADPTDKIATAGWKTTFAVAPLNTSFFVNLHHAVSSTA